MKYQKNNLWELQLNWSSQAALQAELSNVSAVADAWQPWQISNTEDFLEYSCKYRIGIVHTNIRRHCSYLISLEEVEQVEKWTSYSSLKIFINFCITRYMKIYIIRSFTLVALGLSYLEYCVGISSQGLSVEVDDFIHQLTIAIYQGGRRLN
jgi:hypothetical protein